MRPNNSVTKKTKSHTKLVSDIVASPDIKVIDMFCGIGGLTHGFVQAGIPVTAGYDLDGSCRYAYESNNKGASFIQKDVREVTGEELHERYSDAKFKVLVGCAPCQPFSNHTQKNRKRNHGFLGDDYRLILDFIRLIEEVQPDVISMENVPQLMRFQGEEEVLGQFKTRLKRAGYHEPMLKVVYCPDYGIPQHRKRMVLLASRHGTIDLIPPTHSSDKYVTVQEAIGKLSEAKLSWEGGGDALHTTTHMSEINLKRIRASKPGGTWRDWPEELLLECHKHDSGKTYKSVYGRMRADQPSPTITTQFFNYGTGRFGHPTADRPLTVREAAILQSFPSNYQLTKTGDRLSLSTVGRHIGNAVPVGLGKAIAQSIKKHLSII
jgi:DNA (cytosine-5)-methyltransferase 1